MLCNWSKFRPFFYLTWNCWSSLYPIYIYLKLVFRWLEQMERGKELRVLEHIKFITIFTWDPFQVDTNRFLKGCLTKGLWREERMWTTENFQVCIVVGQSTIARSRWEAYKLLWLAVENTQLRNDYNNCGVSNLKICCLIEIVRFSTWSAWSSCICEWNHLRTLSDRTHLYFT